MITIFTTPKPFRGHTEIIQRNAIRSWSLLRPDPEILLLGSDAGTREIAREFHLRHIPEIAHSEWGTPLVSSLFEEAQKIASFPFLCYINSDILLLADFMEAARKLISLRRAPFLMVGQRWDLDIQTQLDFQPDWENQLRITLRKSGRLHPSYGIDYFLFTRGLFGKVPPFAIGRTLFDNWLIYSARRRGADVIDATPDVAAIHQNHDYSHLKGEEQEARQGVEARRNQKLANYFSRNFTIQDSTHLLVQGTLKRNFLGKIYWHAGAGTAKAFYFSYARIPLLKILRGPIRRLSRYNLLLRMIWQKNPAFTEAPELFAGFQKMERVLVLAPHPDDEAIGCGGLLLKLTRENPGSEIKIVFLTDGAASRPETPNLAGMRKKESSAFAEMLGVDLKNLLFLDYPDRFLKVSREATRKLLDILQKFSPTDILAPSPADTHSDHHVAAQILAESLQAYPRDVKGWCYEVWAPLIPNVLVDITDVMEQKTRGIQCFHTQQKDLDYASKFRSLNHYRSLLAPSNVRYAEAYFVCPKIQFVRLLSQQS